MIPEVIQNLGEFITNLSPAEYILYGFGIGAVYAFYRSAQDVIRISRLIDEDYERTGKTLGDSINNVTQAVERITKCF